VKLSSRVRSSLPFFLPFLLLAVLFAVTDLLAMRRVAQLRAEAEDIEQDMLTDIELVARMRRDVYHLKLLVDAGVFEKDSAATLDARVAKTKADYAAAVAEYESMPMLPDELGPWQAVKTSVADILPRLEGVLALSRQNRTAEAQRALADLEVAFDHANATFLPLIEFNRKSASASVARVAALQESSAVSLQVLALSGVAFSVALGVAMTRALQRRNAQLGRKTQKLEAANRELDAFAGRVAHDLRAPLTTATLAKSRLAREPLPPEQGKAFEALQRSFDRMGAIIQDLLAISRLQAGAPTGVCDPAAAAEQLREELAPRVQGCDVSLVIDVQHARVRCSEGLLRQVMWNLADNAVKYRRAEVPVHVEVCGRAADDRYVLSVRDNGVGLSPDETCRVFEPFYRAEGEKGKPGTGLGLSIVKRAVEANGGTVSVTSEVGAGSMFVARLPLA
jgi:signal transduction histidine kinase